MTGQRRLLLLLLAISLSSACTADSHPQAATPSPAPSVQAPAACTARAQRTTAIYSQALTRVAADQPDASVVYVVRTTASGPPGAAHAGPLLPDDVVSCLTHGLGRFTHVSVVSSRQSGSIPHLNGNGSIPLVDGGFVAEFGPAPAADGKTQVSIDTGGGYGLRGGEYCITRTSQPTPAVQPCGASWIS